MRTLLIAPDLGMTDAAAAAVQIQQSGLEVYPLLGGVTEAQIAEQCQPERRYDAVVWLCHGAPDGLTLGPIPPPDPQRPSLTLDTEQVAAYMQACGALKVVLFAACEGQNTAAQVALATDATVIYATGALLTRRAVTACATVVRALRGGVQGATASARVQGLRVYDGEGSHAGEGDEVPVPEYAGLTQTELIRQMALKQAAMSEGMAGLRTAQAVMRSDVAHLLQKIDELGETVQKGPRDYVLLRVVVAVLVVIAIADSVAVTYLLARLP